MKRQVAVAKWNYWGFRCNITRNLTYHKRGEVLTFSIYVEKEVEVWYGEVGWFFLVVAFCAMEDSHSGLICFCSTAVTTNSFFVEYFILLGILLKHSCILSHLPVPKISSECSGMLKVSWPECQDTDLLL